MARTTIDFGIDLGTTNSAVALFQGADIHVFRNGEGFEYTPSVVWADKRGTLRVGRIAKENLEKDPENAFAEFKLQMGKSIAYTFATNGRRMTPEELSAQVLQELRAVVTHATGEDPQAAVVTVPAAFELPQCEATKRAAQLAGFQASPLLMEPVAAALAYGFDTESDRVFWLVYDFGGGTFDAAVMQVRDGMIQVVNHGGDNHLGGKLIDWEIVDQLLVPAISSEFRLRDLRRGNPRWRDLIAKLKGAGEEAKIRVSRVETAPITLEFTNRDDGDRQASFEYELRRSDVERLSAPFFVRSLNICRRVLSERRLGPGNIDKIVLVGGPTLMPWLREQLADAGEGLGIAVEYRVDPLTIVARGAAVFATTQRLHAAAPSAQQAAGRYTIQLEYTPAGPDPEPPIGGRFTAPEGESLSGATIEFVNDGAHPPWRSGRVAINADGTFMTSLFAEKGRPNSFAIELRDASGRTRPTVPDQLAYNVIITITELPLIHSMGVGLATGEMTLYLEKGQALPARARRIHRAAVHVRVGQSEDALRIPVLEGENLRRWDRNREIGALVIGGHQVRRDIPVDADIEVTVEIDESRLVRTKAYIPILDEEFEAVFRMESKMPDSSVLRREFEVERKRLAETRDKARQTGDATAAAVLARIDEEGMEHDIRAALAAADTDPDAADKADKRLREFKAALDEAEEALEWPALIATAQQAIDNLRGVVNQFGKPEDKLNAATLDTEARQAMQTRDPDILRRRVAELDGLRLRVLREQPGFWAGLFKQLEEMRDEMTDPGAADLYISQGNRAIIAEDVESLKAAVQQLLGLLPQDRRPAAGQGTGIY